MSRYWPIDSFQGINEQYLKQRILYILSEIVNSQSISFNTPNETWEEAMNKIETKLFLHFLSKIFLQFFVSVKKLVKRRGRKPEEPFLSDRGNK